MGVARLLAAALLAACVRAAEDARVYLSEHGHYATGRAQTSSDGVLLHRFAGIPYARRDGPFEMARSVVYGPADGESIGAGFEVNPADGVAVAPEQGIASVPQAYAAVVGVPTVPEDAVRCAQLDVFVPAERPAGRRLRVLVFLHGGMLDSDSRASLLSQCDVLRASLGAFARETLVVSVEYPLGVYGWFCDNAAEIEANSGTTALERRSGNVAETETGSSTATLERRFGRHPRNLALHDVLHALLWVQRHVARFGGDPGDVTLAGHSAGASLAHWAHLVLGAETLAAYGFARYPIAKLLLMSGTALAFDAVDVPVAVHRVDVLCASVSHMTEIRAALEPLEFLSACTPSALADANKKARIVWTPVIDGLLVRGAAATLLAGGPAKYGWSAAVRVLLTAAENEAGMFAEAQADLGGEDAATLWRFLGQTPEVAARIVALDESGNGDDDKLLNLSRRLTEALFVYPALVVHQHYAAAGVPSQVVSLSAGLETLDALDVKNLIVERVEAACRANFRVSYSLCIVSLAAARPIMSLAAGVCSRLVGFASRWTGSAPALPTLDPDAEVADSGDESSSISDQETVVHTRTVSVPALQPTQRRSGTAAKKTAMQATPDEWFTKERIAYLSDARLPHALAAAAVAYAGRVRTAHGVDLAALLNTHVPLAGLRFCDVLGAERERGVLAPVVSFVATGTAVDAAGNTPRLPEVAAADVYAGVDLRALVAGVRSMLPQGLHDVDAWSAAIDAVAAAALDDGAPEGTETLVRTPLGDVWLSADDVWASYESEAQ